MSRKPDNQRELLGPGVSIEFRSVIIDVPDAFLEAVEFYSSLCGEPKFIDGEAWAPFGPVGGVSLNLAGAREATGAGIALSFKVSDLDGAREALCARGGCMTGEIVEGLHQRQLSILDPAGNTVVLYEPLASGGGDRG